MKYSYFNEHSRSSKLCRCCNFPVFVFTTPKKILYIPTKLHCSLSPEYVLAILASGLLCKFSRLKMLFLMFFVYWNFNSVYQNETQMPSNLPTVLDQMYFLLSWNPYHFVSYYIMVIRVIFIFSHWSFLYLFFFIRHVSYFFYFIFPIRPLHNMRGIQQLILLFICCL